MIALLIPDGTLLRAYVHRPRRGPASCGWLRHAQLERWLRRLPVHTVVLVEGPDTEAHLLTILAHADLVVVPARWLRHLPRRAVTARARLAARLALDHRANPLRLYVCRERQPALPF